MHFGSVISAPLVSDAPGDTFVVTVMTANGDAKQSKFADSEPGKKPRASWLQIY
jgi:hypothetical protein